MPPFLSSESSRKLDASGWKLGKSVVSRQRTLDTFLSRSSSSFLSPSLSSSAPPKTNSSLAHPTPAPALLSNFAVVLNSSPTNKHLETTLTSPVDSEADSLVVSDLAPQFRKLAAQASSSVSLARPALPDISATDEKEATSSGATPQPKPRKGGRPKGYRPSLAVGKASHDDAPAPSARRLRPDRPKMGSMYTGKRRGRPPRVSSPTPRAIYESLNPHFNVFICEWQGCQAELHNFATLQKHVDIAHARRSPYRCRWAKCAEQEQQSPPEFPSLADLRSHIEKLHMLPVVWQVGDGPQVSFKRYFPNDGTELPDYLFDKAGNQITPSIWDQKEEDFLTWRNNRRRLKELLLLRDQNMPSEEEDNGMYEAAEGG